MRKVNVMKGDMFFQWKYGFYALYFVMILIYYVIFCALPYIFSYIRSFGKEVQLLSYW